MAKSKSDPASKDAWNPHQYEKFKSERSQPFFDLMDLLLPTDAPKVIDLGCGPGELTAKLHEQTKASQTLGIDQSEEMLTKAKSFQTTNLVFRKGSIEEWQAMHEYDIVFSNAAVQWCKHHPQLLAHFKDALKPGGQLAIQMPMNHDYPTHTLAIQMSTEEPWNKLLKGERYSQDESMLTMQQYAEQIFKLGFSEQKIFTRVYAHILPSRDSVIEWVSGTLLTYFKSRLSDADYQSFLKTYKERLFKILPDDKPFFYPFKRVFIWARV